LEEEGGGGGGGGGRGREGDEFLNLEQLTPFVTKRMSC
jgi:hypothetical protein